MTHTTALAGAPMDGLDRLANDAFAGRVVRKDLVRQVKVGANVPVYVLEFLLGKYCASDDPAAIATGLVVVNQTLQENFIRPDESEKAKAELKRKGKHRLIDKVDVRLVPSEDKFWAHLANFGDKYVNIPEDVVYKYDRLLGGGAWCQLDLVYSVSDDEAQKRPFYIQALRPIQVATFDMGEYMAGRARFSRDEWLDLVMRSIGLEPARFDLRTKLLAVMRLVPMAERNYNLIELGPWGTGKSFVYRETSPNAVLISGGRVSVAQLFVNLSSGRIGLLGMWDVVAFDEVAGLEMSDSTVVNMLKDYMESGSFARGKEEAPAEASIVLIGNTSKPHQELVRTAHLFADLPKAMIDPAFLDRLHFYLPGWEVPKLEQRLFTGHFGLVSDYLAEALRELRKQTFVGPSTRTSRLARICRLATRRQSGKRSRGSSRSFIRTVRGRMVNFASTSSSRWKADDESRSSSRNSLLTTTRRQHSLTSNVTPAVRCGLAYRSKLTSLRSTRSTRPSQAKLRTPSPRLPILWWPRLQN